MAEDESLAVSCYDLSATVVISVRSLAWSRSPELEQLAPAELSQRGEQGLQALIVWGKKKKKHNNYCFRVRALNMII